MTIRRALLDDRPFDETRGPTGNHRLIGNDTALMMKLAEKGTRLLHVPDAMVWHIIQPQQMLPRFLWRRAYQQARTLAHLQGVEPARGVAGVPLWMLGELFRAARGVAADGLGWSGRHRIHGEVDFAAALGWIAGARDLAHPAKPGHITAGAAHDGRRDAPRALPLRRCLQ
jgi:hypothetical protein